jgi:[ribosomal protein S5]-alanine N-acetyltransferase
MLTFEKLAIPGIDCGLRLYHSGDAIALQKAADDIRIARYMFAGFPHPYTRADAQWWVAREIARDPPENFVIEVNGAFAGTVGLAPRGLEDEVIGIIGYWLAPKWWGRGIMTAVVRTMVEFAFANGFRRLEATVYSPNLASARVLEKNGFVLEGRLRQHRVGRDGESMDELLYAKRREDE